MCVKKSRIVLRPFQTGQVWELEGLKLEIGLVGRLLVHYRLRKGTSPRTSTSLASKTELEQYLKKNKAILVQA
jgi:hypothetical protein